MDAKQLWERARKLEDKAAALKLFLQAADAGLPEACNSCGVCFMTGSGCAPDAKRAVQLFVKGADRGSTAAMVNLGRAFAKGLGVEQSDSTAFEWHTRAAKGGDRDGLFWRGVALFEGKGVKKSVKEGAQIFRVLIDNPLPYVKAYCYLGLCAGSPDEAFDWFKKGIEAKDPKSFFCLAGMYQNGNGVVADIKKALELHQSAWNEWKFVDSLVSIGVIYSKGIGGILVDDKLAYERFELAAQHQSVDATNYLGDCCLLGRGTKKDAVKAIAYFERSAALGSSVGMCKLADLIAQKNPQKSRQLFESAVGLGNTDAMVSLGQVLVHEQSTRARVLLVRASEQRNANALFVRAQWHEKGLAGLQQDLKESLELYRRALLEGSEPARLRFEELVVESLPESIKRGGKKSVARFVRDIIDDGSAVWSQVKIMVLGKEGVGKTSLYRRIRGLPVDSRMLSTDGVDIHSFRITGIADTDVSWFDFGGQAVFYPTHQFFLTSRCVYLLVFSFGDGESIERVKYWLHNINYLKHDALHPAKIVLVGTHADLFCQNSEDQDLVWASLRPFFGDHVSGYAAISCHKEGTGIDAVIEGIRLALNQANLGAIPVPRSFLVGEAFIQDARKSGKHVIDATTLRAMFPAVVSDHIMHQSLEFFMDMGLCVYEKNGLLITDPQWLAKTFAALISFKNQWTNGMVTLNNLKLVWRDQSDATIRSTMVLFEKFGVAFLRRTDDVWIIPSLLKHESTEFEWGPPHSGIVLRERKFHLSFVPYGLFARIISRLHAWCDGSGEATIKGLWQTGIVLQGELSLAAISLDADKRLFVRVKGHGLVKVVGLIASLLDDLLSSKRAESVVEQFIACPHCMNEGQRFLGPTYFDIKDCVGAVLRGNDGLLCTGHVVKLDLFDDDITFRRIGMLSDVHLDDEPFAEGGFGKIYKGRWQDTVVVAKVLKPEKTMDAMDLQKEITIMASLDHPNIVKLHGVALSPFCMVVEFCKCGDLKVALEKGLVMCEELRRKLALDMSLGLGYLHSLKPPIAHRDFRSPNILLVSLVAEDKVCAKLGDFGLSQSTEERLHLPLQTWQWMAPEAQLGDYTETCDLYSLGIVFFELYQGNGEVPFSEFSHMRQADMFKSIRAGLLRPTLPTCVPVCIRGLIEKLWSTDARLRPPASFCANFMSQNQ